MVNTLFYFFFFFFNYTATTEIYTVGNTLSLHDALPISSLTFRARPRGETKPAVPRWRSEEHTSELQSLPTISYAVFCLKKKKKSKLTMVTQPSAKVFEKYDNKRRY